MIRKSVFMDQHSTTLLGARAAVTLVANLIHHTRRDGGLTRTHKRRPNYKRKKCMWPALLVFFLVCVGVPLIVHTTKRDRGDSFTYDQVLPGTSPAVTTASFNHDDQFYLNFF